MQVYSSCGKRKQLIYDIKSKFNGQVAPGAYVVVLLASEWEGKYS